MEVDSLPLSHQGSLVYTHTHTYTYTIKYYSAIRKNEITPFSAT